MYTDPDGGQRYISLNSRSEGTYIAADIIYGIGPKCQNVLWLYNMHNLHVHLKKITDNTINLVGWVYGNVPENNDKVCKRFKFLEFIIIKCEFILIIRIMIIR